MSQAARRGIGVCMRPVFTDRAVLGPWKSGCFPGVLQVVSLPGPGWYPVHLGVAGGEATLFFLVRTS